MVVKKSRKGVVVWVLVLLMAGMTLVGCGKSPEPAKLETVKSVAKVSVGILRLTSSAPIFIGMEKGFFK